MERVKTSGSADLSVPRRGSIANPSWRYRRIVIFSSLVFNIVAITSIIIGWFLNKTDNTAIQIIAGGSIAQSTAVIGSYVFGATFQDINIMKWFNKGFPSFGSDDDCEDEKSTRRV